MELKTFQVTGRPYLEGKGDGYILRTFPESISEHRLLWHRDKEDRVIEVIGETDWKFQLDNELPESMQGKKIYIPKEVYHRVIKGKGDLTIKIWHKQ